MILPHDTASGPSLTDETHQFFSEKGELSASPDFEYRAEQQQLAVEVARSLDEGSGLLAEAGTGVGKSLAYLVPAIKFAIECGKKAVISTHTINLQEQLVRKDLPLVKKLLGRDFGVSLLKGRQNYLCPKRLRLALNQSGDLFSSSEDEELRSIANWAKKTQDGSLASLDFKPSPSVWAQVCSEPHVCTQRTCGAGSSCFFQLARKQAGEATVVVVNHSLFFSLLDPSRPEDQEGFLFLNDFVIFDEAHTLESVAAQQLGLQLSESGLKFDLHRLYHPRTKKGLLKTLRATQAMKGCENLLKEVALFFESVAEASQFSEFGREWRVRHPELVPNHLAEPLRLIWEELEELAENLDETQEMTKAELKDRASRLREVHGDLKLFLDQENEEAVYWVQRQGQNKDYYSIHSAPSDVSPLLRRLLFGPQKTAILTSATLGVGDQDFSYFANRVGAQQVRKVQIGSPFDYAKQMRVHVVESIPEPNARNYEEELSKWVKYYVEKTKGRAFVLFTSYRLMQGVAKRLQRSFTSSGYELFVQGGGQGRAQMLEAFREHGNAVLFGTDSFWTGVDVPGEALSNVIVTRLPFAVPDHPLIASRTEQIEARGGNPFMEYAVPEAILKLRQGVGRLIRSKKDQGIVVLLDNRLVTRRYGKLFLKALPPAPIKIIQDDPR